MRSDAVGQPSPEDKPPQADGGEAPAPAAGDAGPAALPPFPGPVGYVQLWFPVSSETFVFREVSQLRAMGVPVHIYTLYGESSSNLSREMREYDGPMDHLGLPAFFRLFASFFRFLRKRPGFVLNLVKTYFFRRMRNLESLGENSWCFMAGFPLAEMAMRDGIRLLHSPWANGPATAALVASRLTGIPFAFTGRAGDIYPQDGLLREKAEAAAFIRTNNAANVPWLSSFCPKGQESKVHLVYNSLTMVTRTECTCPCRPPIHVLAVGRFARKKGFPYLLTAIARLRRENFPVQLTLVGDGSWRRRIERQIREQKLEDCVQLPGFVPNDHLLTFMQTHDMLVVPSVIHANGDRDGIPNVIMEALSNHMPVIATDVCGISEIIHPGETGILLPQRDADAIAEAIRWSAGHREEIMAMARRGHALVEEVFDARRNIRMLYDLYADACRKGDAGGERA